METEKQQEYWNVFAATGRVEDYLRYRQEQERPKEGTTNGDETDHRRVDPAGDPRGGIG